MSELAELPPAIRSCVTRYLKRNRRWALIGRVGVSGAILLAWVLLWCCLDRYIGLVPGARLAALVTGVAGVVVLLAGPIWRCTSRQADWVAVAGDIERDHPRFQQRLITVTSRLMGRLEHRGSDEILEHLVYDVDREVRAHPAAPRTPFRSLALSWLAFALAAGTAAGVSCLPHFQLPRLVERLVLPMRDLPPVTTTHLLVSPGDHDVTQSDSIQVETVAERIGEKPVWLSLSDDGKNWTRRAMTSAGDDRFTFTISSVDRDQHYYVSGGDAQSPVYTVRVLRRPAVSGFRIRYSYPAYTGRAPLTVSNTTGLIEAPATTNALLTVIATEPLQLAMLTGPSGERYLLSRGDSDNLRQCSLTINRSGRYNLDLISTREVTGGGPSTMEIRAQPDQPPIARLFDGGTTLRVNPLDRVALPYEILDDYGISSIVMRAQKPGGTVVDTPIASYGATTRSNRVAMPSTAPADPIPGDPRVDPPPRRVAGSVNLDLSRLSLTLGDAASVSLIARDTGGQTTTTTPVQILVSPRSIGPETYERIKSLDLAAELEDVLASEVTGAIKAGEADASGAESAEGNGSAALNTAGGRRSRHLGAAAEAATLMRRSLLRVMAHGARPDLCRALATWSDSAQILVSHSSWLLAHDNTKSTVESDRAAAQVLRADADLCGKLQLKLKTVCKGERALAIAANLEDLQALENKSKEEKGSEQLRQSLQRTRAEVSAGATALGLKADASDLSAQLQSRVSESAAVLASTAGVDFEAIAREWASRTLNRLADMDRLDSRLSAAAEAEAVRPDANIIRANDLQLASRAAATLTTADPGDPGAVNAFVAAWGALQRSHDLKSGADGGPREVTEGILAAAEKAREQMVGWAGESTAVRRSATLPATFATELTDTAPGAGPRRGTERIDSLALLAGFQSTLHQYRDVARTDDAIYRTLGKQLLPQASDSTPDTASPAEEQLPVIDQLREAHQQVLASMAEAEQIDADRESQRILSSQTHGADAALAPALAAKEHDLAERISKVSRMSDPVASSTGHSSASDDPDLRERALSALLSAQVRLAALPQHLAEAAEAAATLRQSTERARTAHSEADRATAEHRPAAGRAAMLADQDAAEATGRAQAAAAVISPSATEVLSASLQPFTSFSSETTSAQARLNGELEPALKRLAEGVKSGDSGAANEAAAQVRLAIQSCQHDLAIAQDELAQRDPLVAAKWFARAAAESLVLKPPDFESAMKHQSLTSAMLARAWDESIHRASARRLAQLPAMRKVYSPSFDAGDTARLARDAGGQSAAGSTGPSARGDSWIWRRFKLREGNPTSATPHQAEPAGYEAALKAYFEALGKVETPPKDQ